jgi:putative DNA primase/helicase
MLPRAIGRDYAHPQFPPPIALNDPSPPPVPAQLIRGAIGDFLEAVTKHTETPRELALALGLGVLGTVCQGRFSVRVEDGYFEPLCAWLIAAMEPGNRKTAAMKCATGPLIRWELEKAKAFQKEIKAAESTTKTIKARIDRLRHKAAGADPRQFVQLSKEIEQLEADMPPIPAPPRLMGDDVTPEHLGTLMASQGERLGLIADEGGIFDIIAGRYSNNVPNLDIYLKSYSGSHVRVDRGSRPPIAMDHPLLTVALAPQPDVLRGLADKPGFRGRGLLDRFLYMLPQSQLGYRKLEVRPIRGDVEREYQRAVYELLAVAPAINESGQPVPHVLQCAAEAYQRWKAWQKAVEAMVRPDGKLEGIRGWASKLPGATARVAALMHCAEFTSSAVAHPRIASETMERAISFASILMDHALAVFGSMGAIDAIQAARRLWEVINRARSKIFTARDAWNPLRGTYDRVVAVEDGFEVLIDRNYILPLDTDDERPRKRGRPSRRFIVNPSISEEW